MKKLKFKVGYQKNILRGEKGHQNLTDYTSMLGLAKEKLHNKNL
jgi:hypothetical protein